MLSQSPDISKTIFETVIRVRAARLREEERTVKNNGRTVENFVVLF
jgi:hypothetical protein